MRVCVCLCLCLQEPGAGLTFSGKAFCVEACKAAYVSTLEERARRAEEVRFTL